MLRALLVLIGLLVAFPAAAQLSAQAVAAKVVLDADRCDSLAGGRFQTLEGAPT